MSAERSKGRCLNGYPLGIMLGWRSCKGECDSSHAVLDLQRRASGLGSQQRTGGGGVS